jgi:anti-anti-sigma factor
MAGQHRNPPLAARLPREVDAANEARVRLDLLAMLDAFAADGSGLIIDMAQTRFIDSAGLRAVLVVRTRAAELGTRVCIAAPSQEVRRFLSLVDITGRIPVFDSVAEALSVWSPRLESVATAAVRPLTLTGV